MNNESKIESFEDLEVYQKALKLHLEVHEVSLAFPKFELYELGSQLRRSSNSIPANIAEGWNNKHLRIYIEGVNRAIGERQETHHHLKVAFRKKYLSEEQFTYFVKGYEEVGRMLKGLLRSLEKRL